MPASRVPPLLTDSSVASPVSGKFVAAWITLQVHSALEAVGLTAAVSHVLTGAGISANVIAGYTHDHVFVPVERADDAMSVLATLS